MDMKQLAKDIMQNYPEYSFELICTGWDYETGEYLFEDPEDGKAYAVSENQVAEALPKLRQKLVNEKLFLAGLHSGDESFMDAGNWDSIATDAVVQIVIFGDVIYG